MQEISNQLARIKERIASAALRAGVLPETITLVAVTKTVPTENLVQVIHSGQIIFGENYVQEAQKKIEQLREYQPIFHLIGHLQRNKVKYAVGLFEVIQTIDSLDLVQQISKIAQKKNLIQKILVQINISKEESKFGIKPEHAESFCEQICNLPGIQLRGLMSIGSGYYGDADEITVRREFEMLNQLKFKIKQRIGGNITDLSMGMSNDFEWAIEAGATIVRVGSLIFGGRENKKMIGSTYD